MAVYINIIFGGSSTVVEIKVLRVI